MVWNSWLGVLSAPTAAASAALMAASAALLTPAAVPHRLPTSARMQHLRCLDLNQHACMVHNITTPCEGRGPDKRPCRTARGVEHSRVAGTASQHTWRLEQGMGAFSGVEEKPSEEATAQQARSGGEQGSRHGQPAHLGAKAGREPHCAAGRGGRGRVWGGYEAQQACLVQQAAGAVSVDLHSMAQRVSQQACLQIKKAV